LTIYRESDIILILKNRLNDTRCTPFSQVWTLETLRTSSLVLMFEFELLFWCLDINFRSWWNDSNVMNLNTWF